MKYIITIVECGSITEAAKQLYLSQPSLSNAVKEIEEQYHITIFHRTPRGITLSSDGTEFLSYVRQVMEQTELLEQRYNKQTSSKQLCSISTQHYAFTINAFSNLLTKLNCDEYEFTLRETRTYEIIEDVKNFRSEIGILYLNDFNEKVLMKLFKENHLKFTSLFTALPHVFLSASHPLAKESMVTLKQLEIYPCLSFEQGEYNSFYYAEEILSTVPHKKNIHVSDRATLFNLLIGLNGYTICTGILSSDLNGEQIISVPLDTKERMNVGYIQNERFVLSGFAMQYMEELKRFISEYQ